MGDRADKVGRGQLAEMLFKTGRKDLLTVWRKESWKCQWAREKPGASEKR